MTTPGLFMKVHQFTTDNDRGDLGLLQNRLYIAPSLESYHKSSSAQPAPDLTRTPEANPSLLPAALVPLSPLPTLPQRCESPTPCCTFVSHTYKLTVATAHCTCTPHSQFPLYTLYTSAVI